MLALNEIGFYTLAGAPSGSAARSSPSGSPSRRPPCSRARWARCRARFRADPVVASFPGAIDAGPAPTPLQRVAALLPDEWLEPAATGSPQRGAERVLRQFDLGVDGVIMHGAPPTELEPVVEAYRAIRPAGRFDHLDANPGR